LALHPPLVQGDDGGPVVLTLDGRATVVGIVSHGVYPANTTGEVDGCDPRYLQGAVNVAYHLDWIESNLDVIPPRGGTNATSSKINLFLTRGWQLFTLLFG
jgi:hypothetical protein